MSAQAFYDCKKSLQEKQVIEVRPENRTMISFCLKMILPVYTKQLFGTKGEICENQQQAVCGWKLEAVKTGTEAPCYGSVPHQPCKQGKNLPDRPAELFGEVCRPEESRRIIRERKLNG